MSKVRRREFLLIGEPAFPVALMVRFFIYFFCVLEIVLAGTVM